MTRRSSTPRQIPLPFTIARRADFDMYWPGANRELVDQLRRIGAGTARRNLYLWGARGVGKTHLLHATCHLAFAGARRAAFVPLAQSGELSPALLEGLEELDLVCIDDLDRVAGDGAWETALFHLFNRMRDQHCPLVIAAEASPKGSAVALADLSSRLAWDLVYHVAPLDEASRLSALRQRAELRGMRVPDEVLEFLSQRIGRDTHTLFAWLDRLDAASLEAKKKLTVPFVRELLAAGETGPR